MGIVDTIRIERAVQAYEFWLEIRGLRGKRRRELKRELRTNLKDAAADIGVTQALFNIGSPKELAYAMTPEAVDRPLWKLGVLWALLAFAVVVYALMFSTFAYMDGVLASGVTGREVTGSVFPWIGANWTALVEPDQSGFGVTASGLGPYLLGFPLLVFVLAARPWRAFTRKAS